MTIATSIAAQIGKIGENPAFVTAMAHCWFAFAVLAAAARYGITLWVAVPAFVTLAAVKEFYFDLRYEKNPPQTIFSSGEDFAEYMLGVALAVLIIH